MIPRQRPQPRECKCGAEIHYVNRPLGPTLVHLNGSEWCGEAGTKPEQRAEPVGVAS